MSEGFEKGSVIKKRVADNKKEQELYHFEHNFRMAIKRFKENKRKNK